MPFYNFPNTIFTQIQCKGFWININNHIFGWAPENWREKSSFPKIGIDIWAHTGSCDQRWIARVVVGNRSFGYRTRGDATPDMMAYEDGGWYFGKWGNP